MKTIDAFFDVDGCLINEKYQFTIPPKKLTEVIKGFEGGLRVHLNSNRSLKSLIGIWEMIQTEGVLIYENGLGVFDPKTNRFIQDSGGRFCKVSLSKQLRSMGFKLQVIDTDRLITNPGEFTGNGAIVFCEQSREYTATLYPRLMVEGVPQINGGLIEQVRDVLHEKYGREYNISTSSLYGNILMTPKSALKGQYMKTVAGDSFIASFGDQIPDILMFKESSPGLIGCPNNSSLEVKKFVREGGGTVSPKNYTSACLDFLKYLKGFR